MLDRLHVLESELFGQFDQAEALVVVVGGSLGVGIDDWKEVDSEFHAGESSRPQVGVSALSSTVRAPA
jgi:hypothetical protein